MDKYRQIAFIVALVIAVLVMMLGKACTDSLVRKNSKPVQSVSQTMPAYDYNNSYNNNYNTTPQTEIASQQTGVPVEYVTNMFGEVVGTVSTSDSVSDIQTTTQERSILEQYNENKNASANKGF